MERLTKRTKDAMLLCPILRTLDDGNDYCQSQCCDCDNCKLGRQLVKLAEYEDLEEQGLLTMTLTEEEFEKSFREVTE